MNDEVLAIPAERDGVGLDRVVIVARRGVGEVNGMGRVGKCGLGVADENLGRLADKAVGRAGIRLGLLEGFRGVEDL